MKTSLVNTNKLHTRLITTTKMKLLILLMVILSSWGWGQSTADYTFASNTTGSLALDLNGNAIDMSTGTTLLVANSQDSYTSSASSIGFNFTLMGNAYSQFSVSSNGLIGLGSTTVGTTTYSFSGATTSTPLISACLADLYVGTSGKVISKLVGSSPNRCLVLEWSGMAVTYSTTASNATCKWQVRFYETSNIIEFVYGTMYCGSATYVPIYAGFATGSLINQIITINNNLNTASSSATPTSLTVSSATNITNLNTSSDGSRRVYRMTPPPPCTIPLSLAASASPSSQTVSTISGSFTAASSAPSGYIVVRSTSATPPTAPLASTALPSVGNTSIFGTGTYVEYINSNAGTWTSTGLTSNTTYYYYVFAYNNTTCSGGPLYSSSATTFSQSTLSCPTFSSTISIGGSTTPGSSYATLSAAIADIKACGISQPTILELSSTYSSSSETFPITLSSITGASATNTLTIRPAVGATGLVITSANTTATIDINSGQYWIIDGRPGGTGTGNELSISNTSIVTGGTAIRFINDASNNSVRYITARSFFPSTTLGVILFSTGTTTGNDNNLIEYSSIDGNAGSTASPTNSAGIGIYSAGTSTLIANNNITISNNNIFNYFNPTGSSGGIITASGTTDWTITNNKFYQTNPRVFTTTALIYYGIGITSNGANNMTISGNTIGFASNTGTGVTNISGSSNMVFGISCFVGTTTISVVQNNIVTAITQSSSRAATTAGAGLFYGIRIGAAGPLTISGNTIGSLDNSSSISLTSTSTTTSTSPAAGIYINATASSTSISNNNIGSISLANGGTGTVAGLIGIHLNQSSGITATISNNTIGGTVNNSGLTQSLTSGQCIGILSQTGVNTITNNTIRNLIHSGANVGTTSSSSVIGISQVSTDAGQIISRNTINALSNTNSGAVATGVIGIHYNGPTSGTNTVARNFIYGISSLGTSATGFNYGINVSGGLTNYQNNMIVVGQGNNIGMDVRGINDLVGTNNYYHNTVYVGGAPTTNAANSFAFNSAVTTNTRAFQNNIFVNARSNNASTGKHYAITLAGSAANPSGLTANYNIYQAIGTGGIFGLFNAVDRTDLTAWQTATGQDANSKNLSPCLVGPTSSTPDLHLTDCSGVGNPAEASGITIASVTDDFDGQTRSTLTPVDIGADAGNFGPTGIDMRAASLVSPTLTGCKTATETVAVSITNLSTNAIDFSVNNVTVSVTTTGGYSSSVILSSGTLAAGGSQTVTMPTTIDLSASGTYTFNANTAVTSDVNTSNNAMSAVSIVLSSLGGTYTVGTSGNYTSLPTAITAVNNATCITAPIVLSLLDASYNLSSTPLVINNNANLTSTNTLTIRPANGVTSTITGSISSGALIVLNGADYVTIDGSNSGGTDKSLTIANTATTAPTAISIVSLGTGAGATNNTVKNATINVNSSLSASSTGISICGSTINSTGADNDNNTIQNNTINSPSIGVYAMGTASTSTGGLDNVTITGNNILTGSSSASPVYGLEFANTLSLIVSSNTFNLLTSATTAPVAISLETGVSNSTVNNNQVTSCVVTATNGYGGRGITIGTGSTSSNITVSNNFIAGVNGSNYTAFGNSSSVGIMIGVIGNSSTLTNSTGGINLYNNTVNMNGAYSYAGGCLTTALYSGSGVTNIDIRNNIFVNSMNNTNATNSGTKNYAIYSAAANTAFTNINYNNYFVSGSQGVLGFLTSDNTTLANLTTAFGANTNSLNIAPTFTSATDLHLNTSSNCQLDNKGVFIANVTSDIDGNTRSNSTPDMGADEFTFSASSISWTGGAGTTNPATAGNWNPASVPSICSNIDIPSGLTFYPAYTSLEIGAGVTLTVQSGARLTVNGTLTNNGTLTLESGATLVQGTGNTVAGSGTFNVKQTLTGAGGTTPSGRFWYLGSPVSGATSTVFNALGDNRLWTFAEATQSYTEITTNGVSMSPMQGHVARLGANETSIFTGGLLNTGNYTNSSLTNTGTGSTRGYTLVSNPYPSYLDWTAAYTAAVATNVNLSSSIWYRSNDGTNMVYDIYNATGAVATTNSGGTTTQYIPPMQAFWVYNPNDGTTGSVTFSNSMRSHQNNGGLKSITDFPAFLRLNLENDGAIDQTVLYFDNNAAAGYDNFDSDKMMVSNAAQVYSFVDNKKLAINGMKSVKTNKQVPLTVEFPTTKSYAFNATEVAMIDGIVILEDRLMNVFQDLTMNPVYAFDAVAGTDANRFVVHFQANGGVAGIETAEENGIDIVSNASGLVTITLSEELPAMGTIQIIDINGKVIATQAINEQTTTMNINAATGVYHVLVDSSAKVARKKIVITK